MCKEMMFRMQTVVDTKDKIVLERTFVTLRLHELENLLQNLPLLTIKLGLCRLAEFDVSEYLQSGTGATAFVHRKENAYLFVQYVVLFEEIVGSL